MVSVTETEVLPSMTPLIEFALEAEDEQGQPITFTHPVLFVLDMAEYGFDTSEEGGEFFIAYEDPDEPGTWHDIPTTTYTNTGLVSGEKTTHFSNWVAAGCPVRGAFHGNHPWPLNLLARPITATPLMCHRAGRITTQFSA